MRRHGTCALFRVAPKGAPDFISVFDAGLKARSTRDPSSLWQPLQLCARIPAAVPKREFFWLPS